MAYFLTNINLFVQVCFWTVLFWGGIGLAGFIFYPRVKNDKTLRLIGVMFCIMFFWRLMIPLVSKRYFFPPIILFLIFAMVGIRMLRRFCCNKKLKYVFFLLLVFSFVFSCVNFFQRGGGEKVNTIQTIASVLQRDFLENQYRRVSLTSDSPEAGRIFFYSKLNGDHYNINEDRDLIAHVQQMPSRFDACYFLLSKDNKIYDAIIKQYSIHSFCCRKIPLPTPVYYKNRELMLYKIVSHVEKNTKCVNGMVKNCNFSQTTYLDFASLDVMDIPFLIGKNEIEFPQDWRLALNNKRGKRFSDWKVYQSQDGMTFNSENCGIAVSSTTSLPLDNYLVFCRAYGSSDSYIYFFLYGYDKNGKLIDAQNVGYLVPTQDGIFNNTVEIHEDDLPIGTSFFHIGFIASGKTIVMHEVNAEMK